VKKKHRPVYTPPTPLISTPHKKETAPSLPISSRLISLIFTPSARRSPATIAAGMYI
jgi:hypothetical protein